MEGSGGTTSPAWAPPSAAERSLPPPGYEAYETGRQAADRSLDALFVVRLSTVVALAAVNLTFAVAAWTDFDANVGLTRILRWVEFAALVTAFAMLVLLRRRAWERGSTSPPWALVIVATIPWIATYLLLWTETWSPTSREPVLIFQVGSEILVAAAFQLTWATYRPHGRSQPVSPWLVIGTLLVAGAYGSSYLVSRTWVSFDQMALLRNVQRAILGILLLGRLAQVGFTVALWHRVRRSPRVAAAAFSQPAW